MPKKRQKTYQLNQSSFYKLKTKKNLAKLLGISVIELREYEDDPNPYIKRSRFDPKKGKERLEQEPRYKLKKIHKRIQSLLERIEIPAYIHNQKGRSYVSNAAEHSKSQEIWTLDIKKYFPSTPSRKVYWFFNSVMNCSKDVSGCLSKITTCDGYIPTGSPLSSILAYYCNVKMWNSISHSVKVNDCNLTVYVDDITVSGLKVSGQLTWEIKKIIKNHGHSYHKERKYSGKYSAEITGCILKRGTIKAPNRQYKKAHELRKMSPLTKKKSRHTSKYISLIQQGKYKEATHLKAKYCINENTIDSFRIWEKLNSVESQILQIESAYTAEP